MALSALTDRRTQAFAGGLLKLAAPLDFFSGIGHGISNIGKLFTREAPDVLRRGWSSMSPIGHEMVTRSAKGAPVTEQALRAEYTSKAHAAQQALPSAIAQHINAGEPLLGQEAKHLRALRAAAAQGHLGRQSVPLASVWNKPEELAQELSRRGWTGRKGVTKYLPVGGKSMVVGFGGASIPAAFGPPAEGDEEKGTLSRLGRSVGSNVGLVAGWPTGLLGSIAASELAGRGLGAVGSAGDFALSLPTKMREARAAQQANLSTLPSDYWRA